MGAFTCSLLIDFNLSYDHMDSACDWTYRSTAIAELFTSEDKSVLVDVIKHCNCIQLIL